MVATRLMMLLICFLAAATSGLVEAGSPTFFFTWNVTYGTISPLGIPQQGILINGQFPGPNINSTTNDNLVINVFNKLDEPFLLTWPGIQHKKNSWQDGVLGTNCPIPPGKNYTYYLQVKDQIGSYIYHPSTGFHRAAGGFGGLCIHSRSVVPVPYNRFVEDDFTLLIGDWYTRSHVELGKQLDSGKLLGKPDGVLINGKSGRLDYDSDGKGDNEPLFTMKAGKVYKYRICNVGVKTSLNFRIQGHTMKLVEMEGSHVVQNEYESLDVHVGQCFTVLVTANQDPKDYYLIASTRFTRTVITTTAIVRYSDSKGLASPDLPKAPVGWDWSLNQFRSFRWNLTASAARPNPQGSFHYGGIPINRTIRLANTAHLVNGKVRFAVNGVSYVNSETPLKFAEYYGIPEEVFKYNVISDKPADEIENVTLQPNVMDATYKAFMEIVLENRQNTMQSWILDGYAFFAVG